MYECICEHDVACVWRSEDNFKGKIVFYYLVGSEDPTQAFRLSSLSAWRVILSVLPCFLRLGSPTFWNLPIRLTDPSGCLSLPPQCLTYNYSWLFKNRLCFCSKYFTNLVISQVVVQVLNTKRCLWIWSIEVAKGEELCFLSHAVFLKHTSWKILHFFLAAQLRGKCLFRDQFYSNTTLCTLQYYMSKINRRISLFRFPNASRF